MILLGIFPHKHLTQAPHTSTSHKHLTQAPDTSTRLGPIDLSMFADSADTSVVIVWKPVLSC